MSSNDLELILTGSLRLSNAVVREIALKNGGVFPKEIRTNCYYVDDDIRYEWVHTRLEGNSTIPEYSTGLKVVEK